MSKSSVSKRLYPKISMHNNLCFYPKDDDECYQQESKDSHVSLTTFTTNANAIKYLEQKYATRYTMEDNAFVESVENPPTIPPIIPNYTGRVIVKAKRAYNYQR